MHAKLVHEAMKRSPVTKKRDVIASFSSGEIESHIFVACLVTCGPTFSISSSKKPLKKA